VPLAFIDSNVLIYLASADAAKAAKAEAILLAGGVVSVQVLNEIANVARRKMGLSWPETRTMLQTVRALVTVEPLTLSTHEDALDLAERYGFSTYDALIVAAGLVARCATLWSEDMQDGQVIDGRLTIRNPF
jgi:predicted nucleic acid-binding protein